MLGVILMVAVATWVTLVVAGVDTKREVERGIKRLLKASNIDATNLMWNLYEDPEAVPSAFKRKVFFPFFSVVAWLLIGLPLIGFLSAFDSFSYKTIYFGSSLGELLKLNKISPDSLNKEEFIRIAFELSPTPRHNNNINN